MERVMSVDSLQRGISRSSLRLCGGSKAAMLGEACQVNRPPIRWQGKTTGTQWFRSLFGRMEVMRP